ncbi:MAG TPA: carboxymuconolactone decarboxylase family protein [Chloroflexota bacterium]|jgi:4-carboxymuconolactone decarboxylase
MRLARIEREDLAPNDQAIWDRIAANRHGVGGPYGVLIHVPELADHFRAVEDYMRFDSALPEADREIVIMAVAREAGARYAWYRHETRGRQVGVRDEVIEALRAQGDLGALNAHERLLVDLAHALLRTRSLPEDLFQRGLAELGERQLVELVGLVGHYTTIGYLINTFEVPLPEDATPTF